MALPGVVASALLHRSKDVEFVPGGAAGARRGDALDAALLELAEPLLAAHGAPAPRGGWARAAALKLSSYTSFAPMIVIGAVPDVRLAAVIAGAVAAFNLLASGGLRLVGVYKIWPKVFDIVNLCIYASMAAVAHTHPAWTRLWLPLFTSGLTANYFLASLLVKRPFCNELARESAPEFFWENLAFRRLNFWISLAWTVALWTVTLSALANCLITQLSGPDKLADLVLGMIMGIAPLVAAIAGQHLLISRFRRRLRAEVQKLAAVRAAGGGGGGGGEAAANGGPGGGTAAAAAKGVDAV